MNDDDNEQFHDEALEALCAKEEESCYITPCAYCGMPADSVDHIPPRCMRIQLSEVELRSIVVREVMACRECNSVLGSRPLITLGERRDYVRAWIKRRYAKYLRIPEWSDEALQELSPSLRGMVQRGIAIRDLVRQRLQWMK